ncbi:DUF6522 family protein [Microvirga sp. CF3016]|uniref:DUF6522 family protein n=1 Tax=Microvirga sp. CF3016 TaxID=3110181 RepID=UPI002E78D140|nr:DUF6522 family protein [Microvirga sp. CF3016]MEE1609890.1 DUF6522 family protein [Microvirga sp. CF3016]
MPEIMIGDGTIQIDASILAQGLGLGPLEVLDLLRCGDITSRCERGIGEDEGRFRLTFFHAQRRLRVIVDGTGRVLQRSSVDFGSQPLPTTLRRPGS